MPEATPAERRPDPHREALRQVLQRLRSAAASGAGAPPLLQDVARILQAAFEFHHVGFFLPGGNDELAQAAAAGAIERMASPPVAVRIRAGAGITGWVAQHGRSLVANDVVQEPRFVRGPMPETASEAAFPVGGGVRPGAVLDVQDARVGRFTPELTALLEDVAVAVGLALEGLRTAEAGRRAPAAPAPTEDKLIALQSSEARYRALFENAHDPIFTLDIAGRFTSINRAGESVSGYHRSELAGRPFETLVAAESLRFVTEAIQLLKAGKEVITGELDILTKAGERKTLEISASPLWQGGRVTGIEGLARDVSERRRLQAQLADHTRGLEEKVYERTREVEQTRDAAMLAIAKLAESIDTDTEGHIERVRNYSRVLAQDLRSHPKYKDIITRDYVELIYGLSPLHDIGKVGIRDHILLKPGRLTPEEFEEMSRHTTIGADALRTAGDRLRRDPMFSLAEMIARFHHEHWDGRGYPAVPINGEVRPLRGHEIPLCARIIAVADVYDALTSRRPYKAPYPHEQAKAMIVADSGKHFDPEVVNAFLRREPDFLAIHKRYQTEQPPVGADGVVEKSARDASGQFATPSTAKDAGSGAA